MHALVLAASARLPGVIWAEVNGGGVSPSSGTLLLARSACVFAPAARSLPSAAAAAVTAAQRRQGSQSQHSAWVAMPVTGRKICTFKQFCLFSSSYATYKSSAA